jgi:multidrug efflux pump subunit AcrA (membrane-fusion protein)
MAAQRRPLFREKALAQTSSPERLDTLIQVTSPVGWLALIALCGLIVAALIWGILGSVPTSVMGEGILITGGVVNRIVAPVAGEVSEISVAVGDTLAEGQKVAQVAGVPVTSPYSGRVLQMLAGKGSYVSVGDLIFTLEPASSTMQVVVYVPLTEAKRIKPGMKAQISPSTVKREEYGFMPGTVRTVAEFPSTAQSIGATLVNDELVKTFTQMSAPVEIRIDLQPDPNTTSGYRWSSPSGPPLKLSNGTLLSASIVVEEQRPITLILPFLKDMLR